MMEDRIANEVIGRFEALPKKNRPSDDGDGVPNWVPLSGIVIEDGDNGDIRCVALATGMKCLPSAKVPAARGLVLHDWHAEILALRVFNHFLVQECLELARTRAAGSPYLRRRDEHELSAARGLQPFAIRERLKIHMYCSEAPCGDASMELTMDAQDDPTPWPRRPPSSDRPDSLKGRESFSELGIVRRKPARGDSPRTVSKSCSDKLALKQCTSSLSSLTSLLVSPENAYLSSLVIPLSQRVPSACERAFAASGRMRPVSGKRWSGGYAFRAFDVRATGREFDYSRRRTDQPTLAPRPSNISATWSPRLQETLLGGVLQGRRQTDPRGASAVSRKKMWAAVAETMALLAVPAYSHLMTMARYSEVKQSTLLGDRVRVKDEARAEALKGWVRNVGDDFDVRPD